MAYDLVGQRQEAMSISIESLDQIFANENRRLSLQCVEAFAKLPEHRNYVARALFTLSTMYGESGDQKKADESRHKAQILLRQLDPNKVGDCLDDYNKMILTRYQ